MPTSTNTQTQSPDEQFDEGTAWVKPGQVQQMRSATVANSADYLATRNDALICLMYDTGLRVSETIKHRVDTHLDLDDAAIRLPSELQKQYPNGKTPPPMTIGLADETVRTLRTYLASRWKDSDYLFPSRQSLQMTTESVRNVISDAAADADINPYVGFGGRGTPDEITPHTLRHSVAYRMLSEEDEDIYAVKQRLRHSSLQTTDDFYSHFDRV